MEFIGQISQCQENKLAPLAVSGKTHSSFGSVTPRSGHTA